jgi:hypothetical protein
VQPRSIQRLKSLHAKADLQLVRELKSRLPNGVEVVRLKTIQLAMKNRIAAFSAAMATPQIT